MTQITMFHAGRRYCVRSIGHATGSPEVCNGVSALLFALAGWLANKPPGVISSSTVLRSGCADISFTGGRTAGACYDLTMIGLAQLAATDGGEHIRMTVDGEEIAGKIAGE